MSGRSKLTPEQKEEIRKLYKTGDYSHPKLAAMYGVSKYTIFRVINDPDGAKINEQNRKYQRENYEKTSKARLENNWHYTLTINKNKDHDIIDHVRNQKNTRQYLLNLIKKDMEENLLQETESKSGKKS